MSHNIHLKVKSNNYNLLSGISFAILNFYQSNANQTNRMFYWTVIIIIIIIFFMAGLKMNSLFIYWFTYFEVGWGGVVGWRYSPFFFHFFFSLCWDLYVLHSSVFPHFWFLMLFYSLPVTLLQVRKYCVNSLPPLTISCFKLTKPEVSDFWF